MICLGFAWFCERLVSDVMACKTGVHCPVAPFLMFSIQKPQAVPWTVPLAVPLAVPKAVTQAAPQAVPWAVP